jgi:hypothetical protein
LRCDVGTPASEASLGLLGLMGKWYFLALIPSAGLGLLLGAFASLGGLGGLVSASAQGAIALYCLG